MPKVTDEHRDRRRRQILDAAVACFDRRGLHATTTDEIVAEAGLSAGAIYRYFDSKDAIIEAVAAERHAHERSLLADALAGDDPRASLRSFLERYFVWLGDPDEQRRRRVNVYVWAEALHNPRLAGVVTSGLAPLDQSVKAVRAAVRSGAFPQALTPSRSSGWSSPFSRASCSSNVGTPRSTSKVTGLPPSPPWTHFSRPQPRLEKAGSTLP